MATLEIKEGVDLNGLHIKMVESIPIVMNVLTAYGVTPTITSGLEGDDHMRTSLHYKGRALDWRTRELVGGYLGDDAHEVHNIIKTVLGVDYDVILETTHLHIEYDPK